MTLHENPPAIKRQKSQTAAEVEKQRRDEALFKAFQILSKGTLYVDSDVFLRSLQRTNTSVFGENTPEVAAEYLKMMSTRGDGKVDFATFSRSVEEMPILQKFSERLLELEPEEVAIHMPPSITLGTLRHIFNTLKGRGEQPGDEWIDPVHFRHVLLEYEFTLEDKKGIITPRECDALLRSMVRRNNNVFFSDFRQATRTNPAVQRLVQYLMPFVEATAGPEDEGDEHEGDECDEDEEPLEEAKKTAEANGTADTTKFSITVTSPSGQTSTGLLVGETPATPPPASSSSTVSSPFSPALASPPLSPALSSSSSSAAAAAASSSSVLTTPSKPPSSGSGEDSPEVHALEIEEKVGFVSHTEKQEQQSEGWWAWCCCCCRRKVKSR